MRGNERMVFVGVAIVALAVGFYLLVLAPKRNQASELQGQIDQLHASTSQAEQQAAYGEQARQDFPKYYGRMVVLGKAVPAGSDTASLLVQLNSISNQTNMDLRSITLSQGGTGSASAGTSATGASSPTSPTAAAPTAATTASTASSAGSTTTASSTGSASSAGTTAAAAAPATEASAATLPIGAGVGPAGLPTLPYQLSMRGGYFDVSNFIGKIDALVSPVGAGAQLSPD